MTVDEVLQACCADNVYRFDMTKPFNRKGFVYATNGHIAARTPEANAPDFKPDDKAPAADSVFRVRVGEAIPLPPAPEKPEDVDCERCNGSGECCCHCGDEHACVACDGAGFIDVREEGVRIGPIGLSPCYMRLLERFGVKEVYRTGDKDHYPVWFQVPGLPIEGMLMQCKVGEPAAAKQ